MRAWKTTSRGEQEGRESGGEKAGQMFHFKIFNCSTTDESDADSVQFVSHDKA